MSHSRAWSWRHEIAKSNLPAETRHVLLTLSLFMNELGEGCFPSVTDLAAATGRDRKTVMKHLEVAREAGWITVSQLGLRGRKWRRSEYKARWPERDLVSTLCADEASQQGGGTGGPPHQKDVVEPVPQGGGNDAPKVVEQVDRVIDQSNDSSSTSPVERARASARGHGPNEEGRKTGATGASGNPNGDGDHDKRSSLATERVEPNQTEQDQGPAFGKFKRRWPNAAVDDMHRAQSEYDKLGPGDRQAALEGIVPYREALKAAGRTKLHAAATYLKQRKWDDLDGEPSPDAPYLPPEILPYSALWSAAMIELLRTGLFARKRFVFSKLCKGEATNLSFGRERDGELAAAADQFTKAKAQSDKGRAFVGWLETHMAVNRMAHQMPRFRDDFWLYVPPPDLAKAWGLAPERSGEARSDAPIDTPTPAPSVPAERPVAAERSEQNGPTQDDADAFA